MFYEGTVVDNSSPDDSDRIEVKSVRLSQKYGTAVTSAKEVVNISGLTNMDSSFNLSGQTEIKTKTTFTAYPLNFSGSQTNGQILYPEKGDTVFLTFLDDDETQLYYMLGSKKIEQTKKDGDSSSLKIDFLDVVGVPSSDIASTERNMFKVVFKTLKNNSLTFIDRAKNFGALLRSGGHYISLSSSGAGNWIKSQTAGGNQLILNDGEKDILLTTAGGNKIHIQDNGNVIDIVSAGDINLNGKNINLTASANIKLSGSRIDFD